MLSEYYGRSEHIKNIGEIYPVTMEFAEEFLQIANLLLVNGKETYKNKHKFDIEENCKGLLDFYINVFPTMFQIDKNLVIAMYIKLFSIVLKEDIVYKKINDIDTFKTSNGMICYSNFDEFRDMAMKQNLLFEERSSPYESTQWFIEQARKKKYGNGGDDVNLESMVQTICIAKGLHPWETKEYTIYQIRAEHSRYSAMDSTDYSILCNIQGGKAPIKSKAIVVDLHKHPDDSLFIKEKDDQMNKTNDMLGQG